MGLSVLAVVASTFLLAGFVKGVIGLGLPTVAMGLLAARLRLGEHHGIVMDWAPQSWSEAMNWIFNC